MVGTNTLAVPRNVFFRPSDDTFVPAVYLYLHMPSDFAPAHTNKHFCPPQEPYKYNPPGNSPNYGSRWKISPVTMMIAANNAVRALLLR